MTNDEQLKALSQKFEDFKITTEDLFLQFREQIDEAQAAAVEPVNGIVIDHKTFSDIINALSSAASQGDQIQPLIDKLIAIGKEQTVWAEQPASEQVASEQAAPEKRQEDAEALEAIQMLGQLLGQLMEKDKSGKQDYPAPSAHTGKACNCAICNLKRQMQQQQQQASPENDAAAIQAELAKKFPGMKFEIIADPNDFFRLLNAEQGDARRRF